MASRLGVLLFNLGGPERLEDVKPFLFNLFSDPEILRIRSRTLRRAVAWLIATGRRKKSTGYYAKIGGGSPLRRITEEQAAALAARLAADGTPADVYVGMRAWKPSIDDALDAIARDGITRLVLLPLYPQFSFTTTRSALDYFDQRLRARGLGDRIERRVVRDWHDHPGYVEALAERVRETIAAFPDRDPASVHLLYSAHSIPRQLVAEGDPYLDQTRRTVALVNEKLGGRSPWTLAFQSKVGPVRWLEPATQDAIAVLGKQGVRQVLVVPVSFVSDHIETLYEIDVYYREVAAGAGIAHFARAAALNGSPRFIAALADLVRHAG